MSTEFQQLLAATVQHLQQLKERGTRYACVSAATLDDLKKPGPPQAMAPAVSPALYRPPENPEPTLQEANVPSPLHRAPQGASPAAPKIQLPSSFDLGLSGPDPAVPTTALVIPPLSPEEKAKAMADLRPRVLACVQCPKLVAARKHVVFGVGDINARLMFVGEAPGADEDVQGEPFVGAAGQLLTRIIKAMDLSRETVYIGNILKCRPDTPGQKTGNRKPTSEEMKICLPWLQAQVDIIRPEIIVALGATAVEGLLGHCSGISRLRGNWQTYCNIPLMPTFHPSYLLRDFGLTEKRKVWEDMLQVMSRLRMPISEKQKNYFLKT